MAQTTIPTSVKDMLWARSAGRCAYEGCNEVLWQDILTRRNYNQAYIAHIIADDPRGPRGHPELSSKLCKDYDSLMLLCDRHHRLIDKVDVAGHPVERLYAMKLAQEERIDRLTAVQADKRSNILLYSANVGLHNPVISYELARETIAPAYYPARTQAFELSYRNSVNRDHEPDYWQTEEQNLVKQYNQKVKPLLDEGPIQHLSVFAFAPQPLLIRLGTLLGDVCAVEVYQKHREPQTWKWLLPTSETIYRIISPTEIHPSLALNISLSGTIDNGQIRHLLGADCSIWTLTIDQPDREFMRSPAQLAAFRQTVRKLMDDIRGHHGAESTLHVFPAMPLSTAVEFGRVRMPKVDPQLIIYDSHKAKGGFSPALTIH